MGSERLPPCPGPQVTSDSVSLVCRALLRVPAPPRVPALPPPTPGSPGPAFCGGVPDAQADLAQPHGHSQAASAAAAAGPSVLRGDRSGAGPERASSTPGGTPGPGALVLGAGAPLPPGLVGTAVGSRERGEVGRVGSVRPSCSGPEGSPSATCSSGPATCPAWGCPREQLLGPDSCFCRPAFPHLAPGRCALAFHTEHLRWGDAFHGKRTWSVPGPRQGGAM